MQNTNATVQHSGRRPRPVRRRHSAVRGLGAAIGGILAVYLVGRGIAEFFTVHYSDPASYRNDWGGPSLAGVFAVHTGPAVAIVTGAIVYMLRRRHPERRPLPRS
ncbi:MAG TPA: hypothetical protein VF070_29910 [Streptosporangiaceae bacterium]